MSVQDKFNAKNDITNENGCLPQAETERMAQEAEEYRGEDEINKAEIEAKSGLENYCVTMRNRATEGQIKLKSETGDEERNKENCAYQAMGGSHQQHQPARQAARKKKTEEEKEREEGEK